MSKTIIRHATSEDLPVLLEIDAASFPEETAYSSKELSYFMNQAGAETIVLERGGTIAAFLIVEVDHRKRSGTVVTLELLAEHRLISGVKKRLKVLGRGEVGKALTVRAHKFSGKAAEKIAAAGGATEQL